MWPFGSDRKDRLVVADALTLEPRGPAVRSRLDREDPAVVPPVGRITHVEARFPNRHPAMAFEHGARDVAPVVVSREDRRPVLDESLERGDALVGRRPIRERVREVGGELFADPLDGEGDALGDEREEVAGRGARWLRRSVIAEDRVL